MWFHELREFLSQDAARDMVIILAMTMLVDIILGVIASIKSKRLSSKVSLNGLLKKGAMMIIVLYLAVISALLEDKIFFFSGIGVIIGSEILSIIELLHILGIKGIEPILRLVADRTLREKEIKYGINRSDDTTGDNDRRIADTKP